jgi:hypothetical protein
MSGCIWNTTPGASCAATGGTTLTWANREAGDTFVANGCVGIIVDVDPGVSDTSVNLTTVTGSGNAGGTFLATTSTSPITIHANLVAGTTDCLGISGNANANPALTIIGNITGGSASNIDGVVDTHTVGTVVIGSSGTPSTITGGTSASAMGYNQTGAGPTIFFANGVAATGTGMYNNSASTWTVTGNMTGLGAAHGMQLDAAGVINITGNCIGNDTGSSGVGCYSSSSGTITIVGNIINGTRSCGANGRYVWNPTPPSNGVTGHYFKTNGGGTAVYLGKNTDDVSKALPTFYYIDPTDGSSAQGTAASGGGAWAQ